MLDATPLDEEPTDELSIVPLGRGRAQKASERYAELADAVKRHQAVTSKSGVPRRPRDHELYRQLRSLEEVGD